MSAPAAKRRRLSPATTTTTSTQTQTAPTVRASTFPRKTQRTLRAYGKISKPHARVGKFDKKEGSVIITSNEVEVKRETSAEGDDPEKNVKEEATTSVEEKDLVHKTRPNLGKASPSEDVKQESTDDIGEIPERVLDLSNLFSCFLTALSLHYAYHSNQSPADVKSLCTRIEHIWKKRAVQLRDIRLLLGILNQSNGSTWDSDVAIPSQHLVLVDYGAGKICVEASDDGHKTSSNRQILEEQTLNSAFEKTLRHLWRHRRRQISDAVKDDSNDSPDSIEDDFLNRLPLAEVQTCSSLPKLAPLLAKGQRRLEDFKAVREARQKSELQSKLKSERCGIKAVNRSKSLMERIRAKQQQVAALPKPPSESDVAYHHALDRLQEVIPCVHHLTAQNSRSRHTSLGDGYDERQPCNKDDSNALNRSYSTTLPALSQQLRNSSRNPLSPDEADKAIRVLAADIAPEWISVIPVGKINGVVIRSNKKPSARDLNDRISAARKEVQTN